MNTLNIRAPSVRPLPSLGTQLAEATITPHQFKAAFRNHPGGVAEISVGLRVRTARRADKSADRVRAINRLKAQLLEYFPGLERAFDYSRSKAALLLLTKYRTPDGIRRAGQARRPGSPDGGARDGWHPRSAGPGTHGIEYLRLYSPLCQLQSPYGGNERSRLAQGLSALAYLGVFVAAGVILASDAEGNWEERWQLQKPGADQ